MNKKLKNTLLFSIINLILAGNLFAQSEGNILVNSGEGKIAEYTLSGQKKGEFVVPRLSYAPGLDPSSPHCGMTNKVGLLAIVGQPNSYIAKGASFFNYPQVTTVKHISGLAELATAQLPAPVLTCRNDKAYFASEKSVYEFNFTSSTNRKLFNTEYPDIMQCTNSPAGCSYHTTTEIGLSGNIFVLNPIYTGTSSVKPTRFVVSEYSTAGIRLNVVTVQSSSLPDFNSMTGGVYATFTADAQYIYLAYSSNIGSIKRGYVAKIDRLGIVKKNIRVNNEYLSQIQVRADGKIIYGSSGNGTAKKVWVTNTNLDTPTSFQVGSDSNGYALLPLIDFMDTFYNQGGRAL